MRARYFWGVVIVLFVAPDFRSAWLELCVASFRLPRCGQAKRHFGVELSRLTRVKEAINCSLFCWRAAGQSEHAVTESVGPSGQ